MYTLHTINVILVRIINYDLRPYANTYVYIYIHTYTLVYVCTTTFQHIYYLPTADLRI